MKWVTACLLTLTVWNIETAAQTLEWERVHGRGYDYGFYVRDVTGGKAMTYSRKRGCSCEA